MARQGHPLPHESGTCGLPGCRAHRRLLAGHQSCAQLGRAGAGRHTGDAACGRRSDRRRRRRRSAGAGARGARFAGRFTAAAVRYGHTDMRGAVRLGRASAAQRHRAVAAPGRGCGTSPGRSRAATSPCRRRRRGLAALGRELGRCGSWRSSAGSHTGSSNRAADVVHGHSSHRPLPIAVRQWLYRLLAHDAKPWAPASKPDRRVTGACAGIERRRCAGALSRRRAFRCSRASLGGPTLPLGDELDLGAELQMLERHARHIFRRRSSDSSPSGVRMKSHRPSSPKRTTSPCKRVGCSFSFPVCAGPHPPAASSCHRRRLAAPRRVFVVHPVDAEFVVRQCHVHAHGKGPSLVLVLVLCPAPTQSAQW